MILVCNGTKSYTVLVMKKGVRDAPIHLARSPYEAPGDAFRSAANGSMTGRRAPSCRSFLTECGNLILRRAFHSFPDRELENNEGDETDGSTPGVDQPEGRGRQA